MVEKQEMVEIEQKMETLLNQLKTLIVFSNEIAKLLLPDKLSKKFKSENELNESISKREHLIQQGKLITKWINKSLSSQRVIDR